MAARSPGGKSVGRVSIRAVPDTSRFREDLRTALNRIERTEFVHIAATISDKQKAEFLHDVRQLVKNAEDNKVNLAVAASTAAASAQLRFVSRPRTVPLRVQVTKASLAAAATLISTLTGARVAANWVEDLARGIGNIDKNLPKIALATTGLSSLTSVLFATLSGIVGIGQGLFAILPALLVVPGLFAGIIASAGILVVALADAKTQLADLSPSMQELGDIIRQGFWSKARQPILDLVNNLMPQLRNSFRDSSEAIGGFIGGLAASFDREFANGRFERIFAGMRQSFAILTTGTDAFAGALVSLFQIAANYTPRLAQWFVDIANRFDKWLKTTSEDGRLTGWIDGAIVAMKQLWRSTAATGRLLSGIWRAAEAAGGGGLAAFARNMERIADAANGPAFQKGLTAIFKGAQDATDGLAVGIKAIGRLLERQSPAIEHFLGTAGVTFGLFIANIANALNTPEIAAGLTAFIDGLQAGFFSFGQYLPQVSDGLAALGKFAGELGRILGPVLGTTLSILASALQPFLDYLTINVLPIVGEDLRKALEDLREPVKKLAEALGPLVGNLTKLASKDLIPVASAALQGLFDWMGDVSIPTLSIGVKAWTDLSWLWSNEALDNITKEATDGLYGPFWDAIFTWATNFDKNWQEWWDNEFMPGWVGFWGGVGSTVTSAVVAVTATVSGFFVNLGVSLAFGGAGIVAAFQKTWSDARDAVGQTLLSIGKEVATFFAGAGNWLFQAGRDIVSGFISGVGSMIGTLLATVSGMAQSAVSRVRAELGIHSPSTVFRDLVGKPIVQGIALGITGNQVLLDSAFSSALTPPRLPDLSWLGSVAGGNGGSGATRTGGDVNLNIVNPTVRDLIDDVHTARDVAASLLTGF